MVRLDFMAGSIHNRKTPPGSRSDQQPATTPWPPGLTERDQAAIAFWSEQYGRTITTEELYEVRHNFLGFYRLLIKLDQRRRRQQASDTEESDGEIDDAIQGDVDEVGQGVLPG